MVEHSAVNRVVAGSSPAWGAICGALAQLGERLNGIQEVVGSIPIGSTIISTICEIGVSPSGKAQDFDSCIPWFESRHPSHLIIKRRGVAQLVEHRSSKPGVAGSSPVSPAICDFRWWA